MPTYVVACKARPPVEGADVVDAEISRAHRYYNRLVELYRAMADALDDAKRRHCPALPPAEAVVTATQAALADVLARVRAANAREWRRRPTDADRDAIAAARLAVRDARLAVRAGRAAAVADAAYQSDVARIVAEYQGELPAPDATRRAGGHLKRARAECGVYSASYLRVEAAVEAARNAAFGRPAFRRWDGGGVVGPQLAPPISVADMLAGTTRLKMEHRPTPPGRGSHWVTFLVRVQSDESGGPVWARVPADLSVGQLPDDAVITWASVVRRQAGLRRRADPDVPEGVWRPYYEWAVHLTIRTAREKPCADSGACGINLGWRAVADGSVRVAYAAGSDGAREEVRLPARMVAAFARADELRADRDLLFNRMRDDLAAWLRDRAHPDWLREAAAALPQWRSCRRLGGLQGRWARNRFDADGEMYGPLVAWRTKDTHLEQWELGQRARVRRWRLDHYRALAARLRQAYRTILVDDTDIRRLKGRPGEGSDETVNQTAKYNLGVAAPGLLRQLLVAGGATASAAADITRACHECGAADEWDRAAELRHECPACGAEWDQDENAALNLLARATVVDASPVPARDADPPAGTGDAKAGTGPRGKWARRKADRSRRQAETSAGNGG